MFYRLLADLILIVHVAYIAFVVFGLVLTLLGGALGWQWVRSRWYRFTHLVMIGIVVLQSWLGIMCPLTVWENNLRELGGQETYEGSFIAHWLHRLIFFEAESWIFMVCYTIFGLLVAASFWFVPLRRRKRTKTNGDRAVARLDKQPPATSTDASVR